MTAIYTLESPGGWHLIGRTPAPLVGPAARPARRCSRPATKSMFAPISLEEYDALLAQAAAGTFRLEAEERPDREALRMKAACCESSRPA